MYKFDKYQTFTQAKTANFPYEISDIMNSKKIGEIISDDKGKKFKIIKTSEFKAYFDIDSHFINMDGIDSFHGKYGKCQSITVIEYYPPFSPENALYRKYKTGFNIRIK